jgi:hypothetical protein
MSVLRRGMEYLRSQRDGNGLATPIRGFNSETLWRCREDGAEVGTASAASAADLVAGLGYAAPLPCLDGHSVALVLRKEGGLFNG